jgi:GH25 family lysozyme M1 (1,4-beta-N-acetylmuramidase)
VIAGYDIGEPQGVLTIGDWRAIAASDRKFVFVRCSSGNNGVDPRFAPNLAAARAVGVRWVGAYHVWFALPATPDHPSRDPVEQARLHFRWSKGVGSSDGDLPPAVDFEYPEPKDWARFGCSAEQIVRDGTIYLAEMERLFDTTPIVYVYPDWMAHVRPGGDLRPWARCPHWAAEYGLRWPSAIPPWQRVDFWQRGGGDTARLPNGARVDDDVFTGTEVELDALCRRAVDVTDGGADRPVHPPIDPEAT